MEFNCDWCGLPSECKPSEYRKKIKHFCSTNCYTAFRKLDAENKGVPSIFSKGNKAASGAKHIKWNPETGKHDANSYRNHRCRCSICTLANREKTREYRKVNSSSQDGRKG